MNVIKINKIYEFYKLNFNFKIFTQLISIPGCDNKRSTTS